MPIGICSVCIQLKQFQKSFTVKWLSCLLDLSGRNQPPLLCFLLCFYLSWFADNGFMTIVDEKTFPKAPPICALLLIFPIMFLIRIYVMKNSTHSRYFFFINLLIKFIVIPKFYIVNIDFYGATMDLLMDLD